MDNSLKQQSEHFTMSDNFIFHGEGSSKSNAVSNPNPIDHCIRESIQISDKTDGCNGAETNVVFHEEGSSKTNEVHAVYSDPNPIDDSIKESIQINGRNESGYNSAENELHNKKDTNKCSSMDLLVKLGNDTSVYNLSKSLERVRCMINSMSAIDMLFSPILPHQRCVTYISEAQKTVKDNQKENLFKFVSSYPSASILSKKYRLNTKAPVVIIGDVTNVQEDQCSYVFICAYMNDFASQSGMAANALKLLGIYSSSIDESSSDDGCSTVDSSDNSSSSSSDYSSADEDEGADSKNCNKIVKKQEGFKPKVVDVKNPLVFLEDGVAEKLPPVRECHIKVLKQNCIEIGFVMHIHELLVSIQSYKDSPALNVDTLLFLEDNEDKESLQSLGYIYEVIGPVDEPVYCITFKEDQNNEKKQIKQGAQVYISPSPEHTHFVFVQDLLKQKGSDASWKNDVEPPEQFIEYSDDEEERLAKQRLKQSSSSESSSNTTVKRKNTETDNTETPPVNKRRRLKQSGSGTSHSTKVNAEVGTRNIPSVNIQVPPRLSDDQRNGIKPYRVINSGQQALHSTEVNAQVGTRNIPFVGIQLPPRPPDGQHNGIKPYRVTNSGQQASHSTEVNAEVGTRNIPFVGIQLPPRPPDGQRNGIKPYRVTNSGQQASHSTEVNAEVGTRNIPFVGIQVSPMPSDGQHNGISPYCVTNTGQQMPQATQMNDGAMQSLRMQQYGFAMRPMLASPAGLSTLQQPSRIQQYGPASTENGHFLPMPPLLFPPNHEFIPQVHQQQAYFSSPPFPRYMSPFPSPQGQFYNPPK